MTEHPLGLAVLLVGLALLACLPWQLRPPRTAWPPLPGRAAARGRDRDRRGPGRAATRRRGRADARVDEAVVLDLLRAALAAGADVAGALDAVGASLPPVQGGRYRRAARALRLGASWTAAWAVERPGGVDGVDRVDAAPGADRPGSRSRARTGRAPDLVAAAEVLAPSWSDGVDPEPLLAHAASSLRRTRSARAREAAARLGVRLVLPLGLCLLPAFVLLGLVPVLLAAGFELWGR